LKVVGDGQAAIDYLSGRGLFAHRLKYPVPSLVLLDINLPTVSGFQVLEWIRHEPEFQELPVIIFSSSARSEDRLRARELGASDYIEKPDSGMEFDTVLEALKQKWFARTARPPLDALSSGSPAPRALRSTP
jgi:DNA-binding response OmpR family regulator